MTKQKHRDGTLTLILNQDDAKRLFRLVRAGRQAIVANDKNFDSGFAIDVMQALGMND